VSEPAPLGADRALHGFRVLVVDDEPDGLEIAAAALSAAGAEVGTAGNGPDAIAMWEAERYDALVSDLAMPRMDGFQVLDHIVALDRAIGRRPAAVALTAYASNEHRERTLLAGFHAHLAKPYNTTDLISAVSEALRTRARTGASMF
jgi:CheY-like chemotaxis protein